ncbi:acyl-homoserine-lactone synthase [Marimonas arenosa]|uniref:Acyl-homoserine-lactone synthase n=1 Tax=Marimonas arenosa TaxID=1795305 RepID=A0AAE4B6G9_9RHOB|nr:acyl-homoserine-lactone synthase [Marimonas arenosa]MDQ2092122.1 autoinducer synthase [Marimonas arenosa]
MLRFIYENDLGPFLKLAHGMYCDRAMQFRDRLGWDVTVNAAREERDQYDRENPLYVIWQNPDGTHGGSLRLLPTTGPTMVNDHFLHLTGGVRIESPVIWECTRFCLSRTSGPQVAAALMLGGGEIMRQFGVEHFVGIFDAPMVRVYSRIGASPDVLGSQGSGRAKTSVGLWDFTPEAHRQVARRAGISPTLVRLWFARSFGHHERAHQSA